MSESLEHDQLFTQVFLFFSLEQNLSFSLLQISRTSRSQSQTSSDSVPYSSHSHRHHRSRANSSQRGADREARIARHDTRPPPPAYQTLKLPHLPSYTEVDVSAPPPPYTEKTEGRWSWQKKDGNSGMVVADNSRIPVRHLTIWNPWHYTNLVVSLGSIKLTRFVGLYLLLLRKAAEILRKGHWNSNRKLHRETWTFCATVEHLFCLGLNMLRTSEVTKVAFSLIDTAFRRRCACPSRAMCPEMHTNDIHSQSAP